MKLVACTQKETRKLTFSFFPSFSDVSVGVATTAEFLVPFW